DYYYYEIINGEVRITQIIAVVDPYTIKIPEEIEGYPVTTIASNAYDHHLENDSIIIPDSVVTIEQDAFLADDIYHSVVKVVTVPKSVQEIGLNALGYGKEFAQATCGSTEMYWRKSKIDDFIIKGYKGTAAETYALRNGFTFVALDDEPVTTTTPVTTDITTTETTVVTTETTAVSNTAATSSVSTTSATETIPVTTTVTTPDITENVKGDANGDGKLTASDAAFIAKTLAEASVSGDRITVENYPAMDFNQDGQVTAKDAADIARYLAEQSIT
ncbi:MAG: hypothetical protein K2F60_00240, partial [Oscillospiraceae bacterium]|nr:hypothetical protein [Oscillospiraceae bacterium]